MINFLIVTHGEFGAYLVEAAESIVGRQNGVRALAVSSRQSIPELSHRLERVIQELSGPDGLVLFVDMPGGTPGNLAFPLIKGRRGIELVGGVNLYMMISAFQHRDRLPLDQFVLRVLGDGQKSIRDIRQMFMAKAA